MRRLLLTCLVPLWAGAGAAPSLGQEQHASAALFVREVEGRFQAAVEIEIESGWHLYHDELGPPDAVGTPTSVTFAGADVRWSKALFPEPLRFDQAFGLKNEPTWIYGHEGLITVYALGEPAPGARPDDVTVTVQGLTCTEELCLPYGDSDLASSGAGSDATWEAFPAAALRDELGASAAGPDSAATNGDPGPAPASGAGTTALVTRGVASGGDLPLLAFLWLAVVLGALHAADAVHLPDDPDHDLLLHEAGRAAPLEALLALLAYGAGIVADLRPDRGRLRALIIQFATHPVTNLVIGALFVVFALALFGAINLQPPAFLLDAAGRASMHGGYVGVFLMGATLVVTSFTCTAPFVGTLLAAGAAGATWGASCSGWASSA